MNSDINLLGTKDRIGSSSAPKKLQLLRVCAVVLLFGVSVASVILFILISFSPLPQVKQQEQQALRTIAQLHPEMTKIALIEDRLTGISAVLSERNRYDTLLASVKQKMPSDVSIYQISMSKNDVTLTVRSESLESIRSFIDNLVQSAKEKKEYSQVTLNSILSDNDSNAFSLTINITQL